MKSYAKIVCADGFTMSVQASGFHYCDPRDDYGPYTKAEVGFPSEKDPELEKFAEDPDAATENGAVQTVYGYVPVGVIMDVIERRGGMVAGELPEFDHFAAASMRWLGQPPAK